MSSMHQHASPLWSFSASFSLSSIRNSEQLRVDWASRMSIKCKTQVMGWAKRRGRGWEVCFWNLCAKLIPGDTCYSFFRGQCCPSLWSWECILRHLRYSLTPEFFLFFRLLWRSWRPLSNRWRLPVVGFFCPSLAWMNGICSRTALLTRERGVSRKFGDIKQIKQR